MAIRNTHPIVLGLSIALVASLVPGVGRTAEPTDESVVVASMLGAEDVFPGAQPSGVWIGYPDQMSEFFVFGGTRETRQTWTSLEPAVLVVDFRFQFATERGATAFLDAAEEELGEVSAGAERAPLLVEPLPDTRLYVVRDPYGLGVSGYAYLMHHGNLVAKVYTGGIAADVVEADAAAIAWAAAARMVAALSGVIPASPPPGGEPSPGASAGSLPAPDPATLEALLATVPTVSRDRCGPQPFSQEAPPRQGELARVRCLIAADVAVAYAGFATLEHLEEAYVSARTVAQLFGTLSMSGTCEGGGYDGAWTRDGTEAGRLVCYSRDGTAAIDWSEAGSLLLGGVRASDGDPATAWQAWLEAGMGVRAAE